jgi:hypothetical protein
MPASFFRFSTFSFQGKQGLSLFGLRKTATSFLVGPFLDSVCLNCFKKRYLSSTVFLNTNYLNVDTIDVLRVMRFLGESNKYVIALMRGNMILELPLSLRGKLLPLEHQIFPVPGCRVCYEKR